MTYKVLRDLSSSDLSGLISSRFCSAPCFPHRAFALPSPTVGLCSPGCWQVPLSPLWELAQRGPTRSGSLPLCTNTSTSTPLLYLLTYCTESYCHYRVHLLLWLPIRLWTSWGQGFYIFLFSAAVPCPGTVAFLCCRNEKFY